MIGINVDEAIAIHYDGEQAPEVSARGSGLEAQEILDIAKRFQVPMIESPGLIELLSKIETGEHIPESLYQCIAELLAFVYLVSDKVPDKIQTQAPK